MTKDFKEIQARKWPRDLEAPSYLALMGPASRRNGNGTRGGLQEFSKISEEYVGIKKIAKWTDLPVVLVADFCEKNNIQCISSSRKTTKLYLESDNVEDIIEDKGPPRGTRTLYVFVRKTGKEFKMCEDIAEELKLEPVWVVKDKKFYTKEQGEIILKKYYEISSESRKKNSKNWKEYQEKKKEQGNIASHPNTPWLSKKKDSSVKPPEGYLTQREVCDMLRVSYRQLGSRIKTGCLKAYIFQGKRFIKYEEAIAYGKLREKNAAKRTAKKEPTEEIY